MAEDREALFARASAAIAEAKRLIDVNFGLRDRLIERLARIIGRSNFGPSGRRLNYPQDFPEEKRTYQPFPAQADNER